MESKADDLPQGVHAQPLGHTGRVAKKRGQRGLKEETKGQVMIPHALIKSRRVTSKRATTSKVNNADGRYLLEDTVLARLTYHQIGPLDNHNGHKESSVASVLETLALRECPLLAVAVFQIIDSCRVPLLTDSQ